MTSMGLARGGLAPDVDALTAAMAIAPGVYSRNRFVELFTVPDVRRARRRAAVVRGIVEHLVLLHRGGGDAAGSLAVERGSGRVKVRYDVPSLRFERRTELTELEAACVFYLAHRAELPGLAFTAAEHSVLHGALARLAGGEGARLLR